MADIVNVFNRMMEVEVSPKFDTYTGVIIHRDDNVEHDIVAGNNNGRVLELTCPWGTQAMASNMLAKLVGKQYQPYVASSVNLDPAAEMGDVLSSPRVYGGIFSRSREYNRLMRADLSAPHDEEINHEFKFESPAERSYKRQIGDVRASIILTANSIKSTVAASTVKYVAPEGVSFDIFGYGDPYLGMGIKASDHNGEYYLDQEDGIYYLSNGSEWIIQNSGSPLTLVTAELGSSIVQTSDAITSTVAASEKKYVIPSNVTVSLYGFGSPSASKPSAADHSNEYYLDQSNGILWRSNGTRWNRYNTSSLPLITTQMQSQITAQADQIEAKVGQSGGNDDGSFSWVLKKDGHTWKSGSTTVMSITKDGLSVKGEVRATSGKIGGFSIASNYINYNELQWNSTDRDVGIYIGSSGIQLGKNFKVTNRGAVTASSLTITGGSIKLGYVSETNDYNFKVTTGGAVTAKSLTLNGNLTFKATDGTSKTINAATFYKDTTDTNSTVSTYSGNWNNGYTWGNNWNTTKNQSTSTYPDIYVGNCGCNTVTCNGYVNAASGYNLLANGAGSAMWTARWRKINVITSLTFGGNAGGIPVCDGYTSATIYYLGMGGWNV